MTREAPGSISTLTLGLFGLLIVLAVDGHLAAQRDDGRLSSRAGSKDPTADCLESRMASAFDMGACLEKCRGRNRSASEKDCLEACTALEERTRRLMTRLCEADRDGDGVQDTADACPGTRSGKRVNWRGCPDEDGDGVPDGDDRCPGSPDDQRTNLAGCEADTTRYEGGGLVGLPPCSPGPECDRLAEIPVALEIPLELRQALVARILSRRAHTVACPGDPGPPDQPRLLDPAERINPMEVGAVEVDLVDGEPVDGDVIPISLAWDSVEDECEPVTYSVFVEYYHCHPVGSLVEPASYRNEGWCRWMPYLYESIDEPFFKFNLPVGELLWNIHVPFLTELGWDPTGTRTLKVNYMPFWLSLRVIAHDGNGTPSPFGNHSDGRYLVLYANTETPMELLSAIPVAP